jgi:hypothetical protein
LHRRLLRVPTIRQFIQDLDDATSQNETVFIVTAVNATSPIHFVLNCILTDISERPVLEIRRRLELSSAVSICRLVDNLLGF